MSMIIGKPPRHKFYTSNNNKRCVENYIGGEKYEQRLFRIDKNIIFQKNEYLPYIFFLQLSLFSYHHSIYGNINVSVILSQLCEVTPLNLRVNFFKDTSTNFHISMNEVRKFRMKNQSIVWGKIN